MSIYSNSETDLKPGEESKKSDEGSVKAMYEVKPYPDLGADLKDPDVFIRHITAELDKIEGIKYLELGCGTGHHVVSVAKSHPDYDCYGVDLSSASLNVAGKLADKHDAKVTFHQGSYLDALPFHIKKYDVISAIGTIHHCADPLEAMKNVYNLLKDDGWFFLHMYGLRCDRRKFDIKEMLNILEPDINNYEKRFEYYRELMAHEKSKIIRRLASISALDIYRMLRKSYRNIKRKIQGISWSPGWDYEYTQISSPWVDHFCHPCERAYEVNGIQELVDASGFKVVKMLGQGKEFKNMIPEAWRGRYNELDNWDKYRINELLFESGGSFNLILKKK